MDEAYEELERLSRDKDIIGLYDAEKVAEKVLNTRLEGARLEGINQNKMEIAKKMLQEGCNVEFISKITGLTQEEISKL